MSGLERVRKIHIIDFPFTVENGMMTPTFKIVRAKAAKRFEKEIEALY